MAKKKVTKSQQTSTKEAKQIAKEVESAIDEMIVNFNARKKIKTTQNTCGHDRCPLCDWIKKRN